MNPELQRNLWLETSLHRMLAMPAVLGLVFLAISAAGGKDAPQALNWVGLSGFGLLTLLWGTRLAANSVLDEAVDKTWDWQRLSTLGPWTMTWGKLFGATAFAWYGGLLCLFVFLFTSAASPLEAPVQTALTVALFAILMHASSIASALHLMQRSPGMGSQGRRSFGVLLILVLFWMVPALMMQRFGAAPPVHWYGQIFVLQNFLLGSVAVFAAWAVIGAWRAMCQSLAVRTTPWLWMSFLAFLTLYLAGFTPDFVREVNFWQTLFIFGFACSVPAMYLMLFSEPSGPVLIRRVLQNYRRKQWRRVFEEMPLWPLTWVYTAFCALALVVLEFDSAMPVMVALLMARDAAILMFFSAAHKTKRVVGTTLVYLVVLYWLIPAVLLSMDFDGAAKLVVPLGWGDTAGSGIVSAAVQAIVATVLAIRRIRRNLSEYRAADGG